MKNTERSIISSFDFKRWQVKLGYAVMVLLLQQVFSDMWSTPALRFSGT